VIDTRRDLHGAALRFAGQAQTISPSLLTLGILSHSGEAPVEMRPRRETYDGDAPGARRMGAATRERDDRTNYLPPRFFLAPVFGATLSRAARFSYDGRSSD